MNVMKSSRILAVLMVAALSACGGSAKKTADTGDLTISVAAIIGGPQIVYVRIYGPTTAQPGVPPAIDQLGSSLVSAGNVFTVTFPQIPAGTYQIHARGYAAFDQPYTDPPTWESPATDPVITVTGGNTTTASLFMQEVGVLTFSNNAPWVSLLSSDVSSVFSAANGGTATSAALSASLVDADGDLLSFMWSDDVGGTFGTPSGTFSPMVGAANIASTWTPPPNFSGVATLYLEVVDSIFNASRVSMSMNVVVTAGYGTVIVNVGYNNNPMMSAPLVANYLLDGLGNIIGGGGQIPAGGTTLLSVSAFDPNGDALSFSFTDSCGGSFANAVVTPGLVPTDPFDALVEYTVPVGTPTGTCTATATITDGLGGELIVNLGIHVGLP